MCLESAKEISRIKTETLITKFLEKRGISKEAIEVISEETQLQCFAERKPVPGQDYWYYSGPLDEVTRPFCAQLLKMDKVLSDNDIASLSKKIGYNVYEFKGSFNCRHKWVRFRGKIILTPKITPNQIRGLDRKAIKR